MDRRDFLVLLLFFLIIGVFVSCSVRGATYITPEQIENYLALRQEDAKALLRTLIQALTDEWINLISEGYSKPEEQIVLLTIRKAIRTDVLDYVLLKVPKKVSIELIKAVYKTALFVYSPEKASFLVEEFERQSVNEATRIAMDWLLQNEIRVSVGNLQASYTSCWGNKQNITLPYIITYSPMDAYHAEVGISIYSPEEIEPPESRGDPMSVSLSNFWFQQEWIRRGEKRLRPFIVRIKGKVIKGEPSSFSYSWIEGPEIEIEFPDHVPNLDFPEPSFFEKIAKELEEKMLAAEKAVGVAKNIFGSVSEVFGGAAKEVGGGAKSAAEKVSSVIKNIFSGLNPFGAQLVTSLPATEDYYPTGPTFHTEDEASVEQENQEVQELKSTIEELERKLEEKEQEAPKNEIDFDELARKIEQISLEMAKTQERLANLMSAGKETKQESVKETVQETKPEQAVQQGQESEEKIGKETGSSRTLPKLLINEVCVGFNGAGNEFVELYNPNDKAVFLNNENFRLKLVSSGNKVSTKQISWNLNSVPAGGYFLLAAGKIEDGGKEVVPDAAFSSQLSGTSGAIITDGEDKILDRVGWGSSEKAPPLAAVENKGIFLEAGLKTNQSVERKSFFEINNNSLDFVLNNNPSPTNSLGQKIVYLPPSSEASSFVGYTGSGGGAGGGSGGEEIVLPPPKILITEVQIEGKKDFIEIYNTLSETVSLNDWRIRKRTESGSEYSVKVFPEGTTILAKNYLLWASSEDNFYQEVSAELFSSAYLTLNNSVALFDSRGSRVDALSWGEKHINPFAEGFSFPINPQSGQTIGRKWNSINQDYQDTDDDSQDFEIQFATPKAKNETFRDLTPPETNITSNPPELTNLTQAIFSFSSSKDNSSFECKLDENDWQACFSPKEYSGLVEGAHSFEVRAKDEAGNLDPTPAEYFWKVDTTPPETEYVLSPPVLTNLGYANFVFRASEENCTFQCKLDEQGWSSCSSSQSYSGLLEGQHSFLVLAQDPAGNLELVPAEYSWTIDTTIKTPNLILADLDLSSQSYSNEKAVAVGLSNDGEAVAWLLSENKAEIENVDAVWQTERPSQFILSDSDGLKTVYLWVRDGVGNISEGISSSIILDVVPPVVQFNVLPEIHRTVDFAISWLGEDKTSGVLEYYLQLKEDSAGEWQDFVTTSGQSIRFSGENGKTYYFRIRAKDLASNVGDWSVEVSTRIEKLLLEVSPEALEFEAVEFGQNPSGKELRINNLGVGELSWTASYFAKDGWLGLDSLSGKTPAVIWISADISGLSAGNYSGLIVIQGQEEEKNIPVILILQEDVEPPASPVIISHHQDEVVDSTKIILAGTTEPNALVLIGTEQTRADEEGNWSLEVELQEGENEIEISAKDEAGNLSQPVVLKLFVEVPRALLEIFPAELAFSAEQGGDYSDVQIFTIKNSGAADLDWSVSSSTDWASVFPGNGVLDPDESVEVEVLVDIAGMEAGDYKTDLVVTAPAAENSPQQVSVSLTIVASPVSFLKVLINEIQIDSIEGAGGTADDWVELYNPNDEEVDLSEWSIQRHSSTGGTLDKKNFEAGHTIPAHGYFLIVRNDANQELLDLADMVCSALQLGVNNTVYLVGKQEKIENGDDPDIVDKVGFGLGPFSPEGQPVFEPPGGKSIERKEPGLDTDDNSQDFQINENPSPTNSLGETKSEPEPEPIISTIATEVLGTENNGRKIVRTSNDNFYTVYSKESSGVANIFLAKSMDGGKTWAEEAITSETEYDQKEPSLTIDSRDNLHLVWQGRIEGNDKWQIRYRAYDGIWQEIENLTDNKDWNQEIPVIAVDSQDNAHILWVNNSQAKDRYGTRFGVPQILHITSEDNWQTVERAGNSEDRSVSCLAVAIDDSDFLHVVWQGVVKIGPSDPSNTVRYQKRTDSWGEIIKIGSPYWVSGSYCSIAVDSVNGLHIVWEETGGYSDPDRAFHNHFIKYIKYDEVTDSWSYAENLETNDRYSLTSPSIAIDTDDNLYVVWRTSEGGYNGIHKIEFADGVWQEAKNLFPERGQFSPNLLWSYYPATNKPRTGFVFVYYEGGELKFYASEDLGFE